MLATGLAARLRIGCSRLHTRLVFRGTIRPWENARFQELLLAARAELDSNKRREQYREMQMLMSTEGGTVIPMYANYVDAHSSKLTNSGTTGNVFQMDSSRFMERWWFA